MVKCTVCKKGELENLKEVIMPGNILAVKCTKCKELFCPITHTVESFKSLSNQIKEISDMINEEAEEIKRIQNE